MEYTGFIFRDFVKFLGEMFRNVANQLEAFDQGSIKITSPGNEIKRYFKKNFYEKTCDFSRQRNKKIFKKNLYKNFEEDLRNEIQTLNKRMYTPREPCFLIF